MINEIICESIFEVIVRSNMLFELCLLRLAGLGFLNVLFIDERVLMFALFLIVFS